MERANNMIRSKSLSSLQLHDKARSCFKDLVHHKVKFGKTGSTVDDIHSEQSSDGQERVYGKGCTTPQDSLEDIEYFIILERKIEKLSDLLQEQQNVLFDLKKDLNEFTNTYALFMEELNLSDKIQDLITKEFSESTLKRIMSINSDNKLNDRAKSFLDCLELKRNIVLESSQCMELDIKDALTKFLQSDDLKEQILSSTEQCVKDVVRSSLSQNFTAAYLPIMEQSHHRLLRQVTRVLEESFEKLENNLGVIYTAMHKKTRSLRQSLQIHQSVLEEVDPGRDLMQHLQLNLREILQKELQEWRENVFNIIYKQDDGEQSFEDDWLSVDSLNHMPPSPPQPSDPTSSIIVQLLKSAEINKEMKEGNVNGSFEKALSSSDLALVTAACRAADPVIVFAPPCKLHQPVLLSLIQQLATDMVHDTQLKCRYLEDAIINLNTFDAITRSHLPLVVTDVRKHLTKFLISYPNHVASRRVRLIIMAANNLLK